MTRRRTRTTGLAPETLSREPEPGPPCDEEYYSDGVWYDAEYVHIKGDIPYYVGVAAGTKGRVLELAAGTGRLTIPMAMAGAHVLGVDVSPGMIREANAKRALLPEADRARLELRIGDMRSIRLGETFGAVILAFNTLMHMTRDEDLEAVFDTARVHLAAGGLFHLDLYTPHPAVVPREDPSGRYDPEEMIDPRTGRRYVVTENNEYEARHQINSMRFYYQEVDRDGRKLGEERRVTLRLRVIFPRELDRWIYLAGFEILEDWDDFEKTTPFSGEGGRRVLVLRHWR